LKINAVEALHSLSHKEFHLKILPIILQIVKTCFYLNQLDVRWRIF